MKTVFINCSPKKRFCASAYFMFLMKLFTPGSRVSERLRTAADYDRVLEQLRDADSAVFSLPLYVDGVPSHILRFLQRMETFSKENGLSLRIYCVANNGFIEGKQNEPLMQVFENFCSRSGHEWCGGIGIGGGVMLNVYRIVFTVQTVMFLVSAALNLIETGNPFPAGLLRSYGENALIVLYLNIGVLFYTVRMAWHISRGTPAGKKYTRIMVPSFLFILFADVFFVIISVIKGGIFRGWLAKKQPDTGGTRLN